jgi:nitrogenase molybdenum-iron protein alpha chain
VEYNFFGPTMIEKSLREIASHFDDSIKAKAEDVSSCCSWAVCVRAT